MRLGSLFALCYLLCVLAPAAALALGNGPAPCLTHKRPPLMHSHGNGPMQDSDRMHEHHRAIADATGKDGLDGKKLPGPCCAMMCATALLVELPMIGKPSETIKLCVSEANRSMPDEAPTRLYRPPIARS